jgi:hypothetical protein
MAAMARSAGVSASVAGRQSASVWRALIVQSSSISPSTSRKPRSTSPSASSGVVAGALASTMSNAVNGAAVRTSAPASKVIRPQRRAKNSLAHSSASTSARTSMRWLPATVDVGRPVQGTDGVALSGEPELPHRRSFLRPVEVGEQCVDHDVADVVDPSRIDALPCQVRIRIRRRGEVDVREVVDDAVDLLGHPPVKAAQAGLDVGDPDAGLGRHQRRGHRTVGVTDNGEQVGTFTVKHFLKPDHHPRGLLGMAARAHLQPDIGPWHAEIGEEHVAHGGVVMLADVHDALFEIPAPSDGLVDRRDLHEVRSRADHMDNLLHHWICLPAANFQSVLILHFSDRRQLRNS